MRVTDHGPHLGAAFGAELRALRARVGWTQAQAAKAIGIVRPNYARSERGTHTPSLGQFVRAAEVFGVDPIELFRAVVDRAKNAGQP